MGQVDATGGADERIIARRRGLVSPIHRKQPKGRPTPERARIASAAMSKARSGVEHVFVHENGPTGLVIKTIGLARAELKIGLANLA